MTGNGTKVHADTRADADDGGKGAALAVSSERDDARIETALAQLRALLIPGETIEAYAVQRRYMALTHRRLVIAATSGRFIALARNLFGGFTLKDVRWQDLKDAQLQVGMFSAALTLNSYYGSDLAAPTALHVNTFDGLRKEGTQSVYRLCQAHEQAWREKRRVRDLEELRAKSGGIQIASAGVGSSQGTSTLSGDDAIKKLEQAKTMLIKGLISDSEYESLKARVIGGL